MAVYVVTYEPIHRRFWVGPEELGRWEAEKYQIPASSNAPLMIWTRLKSADPEAELLLVADASEWRPKFEQVGALFAVVPK